MKQMRYGRVGSVKDAAQNWSTAFTITASLEIISVRDADLKGRIWISTLMM